MSIQDGIRMWISWHTQPYPISESLQSVSTPAEETLLCNFGPSTEFLTKMPPHNAMPSGPMLFVKFFLYVSGNVFLDSVSFQGLASQEHIHNLTEVRRS